MENPIRRDDFFGNLGIPEYPKILLWMVVKSESPVENGGKHPIIYRVSTIRLVVQDFATINSRKPYPLWNLRPSPTITDCAPVAVVPVGAHRTASR